MTKSIFRASAKQVVVQAVYLKERRLIRFLVSGGLAAAVEYSTFVLLTVALDQNVIASNVLSFSLGLVTSFLLNRRWVFGSKSHAGRQFLSYALLAVFNLFLSTILILVMLREFGLLPYVAKILAMVMVAAWNYIAFSKLIFRSGDIH